MACAEAAFKHSLGPSTAIREPMRSAKCPSRARTCTTGLARLQALAAPVRPHAGNAPYEGHKAVDELSKLFFGGVVHDPPAFVEDGCRARHKQSSTEPGSRPQCAQHRQPRFLVEDRAEAAG